MLRLGGSAAHPRGLPSFQPARGAPRCPLASARPPGSPFPSVPPPPPGFRRPSPSAGTPPARRERRRRAAVAPRAGSLLPGVGPRWRRPAVGAVVAAVGGALPVRGGEAGRHGGPRPRGRRHLRAREAQSGGEGLRFPLCSPEPVFQRVW